MQNIFSNMVIFWTAISLCAVMGIFSVAYNSTINNIIEETEFKTTGRVTR